LIFKKYISETGNLLKQNILYKFTVIVIGGVTLLNTFMIYYALNHQTVILVPPGLESKVTVKGDFVSDEYVRSFSRYLVWLLYSYNPATARIQFDEALTYFLPEKYPEVKKQFYVLADQIETAVVSSTFYVQAINIDRGAKVIKVQGVNAKYSQDGKKIEETQKSIAIGYMVINGRIYVTYVKEEA
jgi:conjugal transfer pilus assembly protein TraE